VGKKEGNRESLNLLRKEGRGQTFTLRPLKHDQWVWERGDKFQHNYKDLDHKEGKKDYGPRSQKTVIKDP